MARSRWKLVFFEKNIWKRIKRLRGVKADKENLFFYSRKSTIPDSLYNFIAQIHKGKNSRRLYLDSSKTGYKFGEFAFSRKPFYYPMRRTNQKNNIGIRR